MAKCRAEYAPGSQYEKSPTVKAPIDVCASNGLALLLTTARGEERCPGLHPFHCLLRLVFVNKGPDHPVCSPWILLRLYCSLFSCLIISVVSERTVGTSIELRQCSRVILILDFDGIVGVWTISISLPTPSWGSSLQYHFIHPCIRQNRDPV